MALDPNMNNDDKKRAQRPSLWDQLTADRGGNGPLGPLVPLDNYGAQQVAMVNPAARVAAAQAAAAAAPPQAQLQDNISADNLATVQGLSRRLAPGVSRYALGGDVAGPNATPIYTTRGQHGEPVFTDNADFAARVSTGGLRRGDVNADVYRNAQEDPRFNPNANQEFAPSTLNQKGLQRQDFGNLDPEAAQKALALATSGIDTTDQGLSNRMDANLLRSRLVAQAQPAQNAVPLDPKTQIALMRAKATEAYQKGRLAQGQERVAQGDAARKTAQQIADRQAQQAFFSQYQTIKQTNPADAGNFLVNSIPTDPKEFDGWAKTDAGRQVLNTYLTDVLQPGAMKGTYWWEGIDKRDVPKLGYKNLSLGANNHFQGLNTIDGNDTYAANGPLGTPRYDPSINRLPPAILQRLKKLGQ